MTEAQPTPTPVEPMPAQPASTPSNNSRNQRTTLWVLIAVALLIAVIGVAYWAFSMWGQSTNQSPTVATYDECVQAGGTLSGDVQPVCTLDNGQSFVAPETPINPADVAVPFPAMTPRIQECPQRHVVEMAEASPPPVLTPETTPPQAFRQSGEFWVINGQEYDRTQLDIDWIGQNCQVETETVFQ